MQRNGFTAFGLATLMAVFVTLIVGFSQQDGAASTTPKETVAVSESKGNSATANKPVIIGVDARSVPLTFWDERTNLLSGYDADMAREGFKRAGLEYEFKYIFWADKEKDLKNKTIDVVWLGLTIKGDIDCYATNSLA